MAGYTSSVDFSSAEPDSDSADSDPTTSISTTVGAIEKYLFRFHCCCVQQY